MQPVIDRYRERLKELDGGVEVILPTVDERLSEEELLEIYDHIHLFREGLAVAWKGDERFHVRPDGTPAYEARYDHVGFFSEGLAVAHNNGQWFHIHRDGTPAYEARYDYVSNFRVELARARKDNKRFFIRPDGTRAD